MNKTRAAGLGILIGGLGIAAWAYQNGHAQQEAVLGKIEALATRLAANNTQGAKANKVMVRQIGRVVFHNRNHPRDVAVLSRSQQIIARCTSLADTLQALQRELRLGGGEESAGPLHDPAAPTALAAVNSATLARSLNDYSKFIRAYVPEAPTLAPASDSMPGFTWLYADRAPLAAALASLTRLESHARRMAAQALQRQAEKVGTNCICFNKIGAIAVATANTVAPGAVYEARLFMTQSTSANKSKMSADGQPITVGANGEGVVEFRAPALRPGQPDTVQVQWRAIIKTKTYLADTTFQLNVPYYIVKPRS